MMLPVMMGYAVLLEVSGAYASAPAGVRHHGLPWGRLVVFLLGTLGAVSAAYLAFRHWITGAGFSVGHQVFRKTENPMAFAPTLLSRALSKAHVHAYYASKMIWCVRSFSVFAR